MGCSTQPTYGLSTIIATMRILVVEDDTKIARAIKKGLEQESYSVDLAEDGNEALELIETEEYDLITLDLMLPKLSGEEVCKTIRSNGLSTPIIMLTAKAEIHDKVHGLNCGADDYLAKPFEFEELVARIKALLRRPTKIANTVLTCDNLALDTINYTATRNTKVINLSRREFSLLEFMLLNKDRIVSKDKIISHVWDYDSDILTNTVEQYIGYLRNKIDKNFPSNKKLIHTVRGFGYTITDKAEPNV